MPTMNKSYALTGYPLGDIKRIADRALDTLKKTQGETVAVAKVPGELKGLVETVAKGRATVSLHELKDAFEEAKGAIDAAAAPRYPWEKLPWTGRGNGYLDSDEAEAAARAHPVAAALVDYQNGFYVPTPRDLERAKAWVPVKPSLEKAKMMMAGKDIDQAIALLESTIAQVQSQGAGPVTQDIVYELQRVLDRARTAKEWAPFEATLDEAEKLYTSGNPSEALAKMTALTKKAEETGDVQLVTSVKNRIAGIVNNNMYASAGGGTTKGKVGRKA
ncbi:MAG: hypothetical protein ACOZIN_09810 [Myxococcota bacterium]